MPLYSDDGKEYENYTAWVLDEPVPEKAEPITKSEPTAHEAAAQRTRRSVQGDQGQGRAEGFATKFLDATGTVAKNMAGETLGRIDTFSKMITGEIPYDEELAVQTTMGLAMDFGTAGLATAPMRPGIGTFGGIRARGAPVKDLEQAQMMKNSGANPDLVWRETGWFQGADGRWRFEVSDSGARLKTENLTEVENSVKARADYAAAVAKGEPVDWRYVNGPPEPFYSSPDNLGKYGQPSPKLGEIIDHPELFKQYPFLKDIELKFPGFSFGTKGWYDETANTMALGSATEKDMFSTAMHEIQHAIQAYEKFNRGGNISIFFKDYQGYKQAAKTVDEEAQLISKAWEEKGFEMSDRWNLAYALKNIEKPDFLTNSWYKKERELYKKAFELDPQLVYRTFKLQEHKNLVSEIEDEAYKLYKSIAGEAEARNVQKRLELSDFQKERTHPQRTEDVSREDQIVHFGEIFKKGSENRTFQIGPTSPRPLEDVFAVGVKNPEYISLKDASGKENARAVVEIVGDTLKVEYIYQTMVDALRRAENYNTVGLKQIREFIQDVKETYPNVKYIEGIRIGGARMKSAAERRDDEVINTRAKVKIRD